MIRWLQWVVTNKCVLWVVKILQRLEAFHCAHWLLSNLIFPRANEIVQLKLEYICRLFSEAACLNEKLVIQTRKFYDSILSRVLVCTMLEAFFFFNLERYLNYALWFNVSLFLLSPSFHNFHEDRSPVEEWKHMANKVIQIYATRAHMSFGPL